MTITTCSACLSAFFFFVFDLPTFFFVFDLPTFFFFDLPAFFFFDVSSCLTSIYPDLNLLISIHHPNSPNKILLNHDLNFLLHCST
jgi:hypothetical protein